MDNEMQDAAESHRSRRVPRLLRRCIDPSSRNASDQPCAQRDHQKNLRAEIGCAWAYERGCAVLKNFENSSTVITSRYGFLQAVTPACCGSRGWAISILNIVDLYGRTHRRAEMPACAACHSS